MFHCDPEPGIFTSWMVTLRWELPHSLGQQKGKSSGLSQGPPPINTIPGSLLAFLVFGFSLLIVSVHLFT